MKLLLMVVLIALATGAACVRSRSGENPGGVPLPEGARLRTDLGGATSVQPGSNRTLQVFETVSSVREVEAFYDRAGPWSDVSRDPDHVEYRRPGIRVRIQAAGTLTRIEIVQDQ